MTAARDPSPEPLPRSYWGLLRRYRGFRRLWLGDLSSFIGDWFNTVALFTAVQALSDSAQAVAAVMVAKTLPTFLVVPIAGRLVDRYSRRALLVISDILRAAGAIGLALSHALGSLEGLYAVIVLMVVVSGVAFPARSASLPHLVPRAAVPMANALAAGTWSVMLALGASLGGVATALFGVQAAFLIDAATFLVSAFFFWGLPVLTPPRAASPTERPRFVDGLRYLAAHPYVAALTATKPMLGLLGGALALLPLYAQGAFPGTEGPLFLGLLYAARGVGALIGSLVTRRVVGDTLVDMRRTLVGGFAVAGVAYVALAHAAVYWQAALAFLVGAVGTASVWVASSALLQLEADARFHGRVFSLEFGVMTLSMALSSWGVGWIGDTAWGLHGATLMMASLAVLPVCLWLTLLGLGWPLRSHAIGVAELSQQSTDVG